MQLKTRIETPLWTDTVAFYRDIIGLEVLESWETDRDIGAILGSTSSQDVVEALEIGHTDSPVEYGGLSLQFRVQNLDAALARLHRRWEFSGPTVRPWGSVYVYLFDPCGIQVILYSKAV